MRVFQDYRTSLSVVPTALFCLLFAIPAHASIIYNVSVNTSAISGTPGNLDFQLDPGFSSQPATAGISGFSSTGGTLGAGILSGDASGMLPGAVTLNNTTGFNDLFQSFSYGSAFQFQLVFSGPAITAPNGTASAGSTFILSLYNSDGSAALLTTSPDGSAGSAVINLDGSVSTFVYPSDPNGGRPVVTFTVAPGVPEPSSLSLMCLPLLALAGLSLHRKFQY
ncbi:MAG: NF038129 family PEP-CTERM protein [Acidobacteriota bacterium]|nr:NF038129 family PEP-CTERM protein [Acidobacteriota bacterium]